jgi:hypothetical protein
MSVYGTRTALELERQRRADIAARQDKQPAADAGGQAPAYGPDNPPRLRKQGESVEDYRVAMGWDAGNKVKQFEDDQKRSTFEFSQWIPGLDKPTTTSWDAWKAGREHLLAFQWKQAQQGEAKDVRQPAAGAVNQPLMPEPILWRVMWDDGEPGDGGFEDCASAKEAEEYAEDTRRHDWRNVRIVKLVDADAIARQPGQAAPCKS